MWLQHCLDAFVWAGPQRTTCHRQRPTQPRQEYHAHRLGDVGRGRGFDDPRIGATNAAAFEAYLEHILVPSLHSGQVVVMDNLRVHKSARVRQLIEEAGCQVLFLPAYSPDFSPIEEMFSKVKAHLRRMKARTREALEEALTQALLEVTSQDAHGWFEHCGFGSSEERKS